MSKSTGAATNYGDWDKKASNLISETEKEEEQEKRESQQALGLDGKYAHSRSEQEERQKAKQVRKAKRVLDGYQKRESEVKQVLRGLLGPPETPDEEAKPERVIRVTRDRIDAGRRVVEVCDTSGASQQDKIVLTQDLSLLESKMNANALSSPKSYEGDAENEVEQKTQQMRMRTVYGVIKVFLSNVHNCTVVLNCKIISGTVELSHCSNICLRIEKETTAATVQADLCKDMTIEFHDAPSGQNTGIAGQHQLFWGDDRNDRIFHAGVSRTKISLVRDGFVDAECMLDYEKDGAISVGNAPAEEFQFVTSVLDGELVTEKVIRNGASSGSSARAMTQRELDEEEKKRERAAGMALDKAIQLVEKGEGHKQEVSAVESAKVEGVEEIYTMDKTEMDRILAECEQNKRRGNEAFEAGEYAQAVLLYTLALDKAQELPDKDKRGEKQLFPRHIVYANRSASFLKLGEHEKALADGKNAQKLDPTYVKGFFRTGLALHALRRYSEAIDNLAKAQKLEPKNKQIKQALQFAEMRMTQEIRKRMGDY